MRSAGSHGATVKQLDAISARALGIRTGGALLARLEGATAGWWPSGTDAVPALHAAVTSLAGGSGLSPLAECAAA